MSDKKRVTLIPGDGVGPEVVDAARKVVDASGAKIAWEEAEAGSAVFMRRIASGVTPEKIASSHSTHVVLKGPLATPVGCGEKSANVTLRTNFETFGNIRPVRNIPGVNTPYANRPIDMIVVRENVEDLYAGIEYQQTPTVSQSIKLMSRTGCEKIVRLAFEIALTEHLTLVHCATKANILKLTEGMLKDVFEKVAREYPSITSKHIIIDNCAHQLVVKPEQFQVIVTSNMNGDIISDLTSGLVGGLGLAPSANLGKDVAIFEAVHGSAPDIAGQDKVNPTALILTSALMLQHIGDIENAAKIENAVLATIESGDTLTGDLTSPDKAVGTKEFTAAVIDNLGNCPTTGCAKPRNHLVIKGLPLDPCLQKLPKRRYVGVDVFVESTLSAIELGNSLNHLALSTPLKLKLVSNRGTRVFPPIDGEVDMVDHWRCRFFPQEEGSEVDDEAIILLLRHLSVFHKWMHIEKLMEFDGVETFSKSQGED
jgi:isocitrate dehydrogenase